MSGTRRGKRHPTKKKTLLALSRSGGAWSLGAGSERIRVGGSGAVAIGAAAFGAVAIGALGIRRLAIGRGKVGRLSIDELEVGRLRVRESMVDSRREPHPFEALEGHDFVSLTTFRESGEAVSTPVWFTIHEGCLYVTTDPGSGKMKRIRENPRVTLTPCNARGRTQGESVEGIGRVLSDGEAPERATRAFREKYRLKLALLRLFVARGIGTLTLEVRPVEEERNREESET